MNDTPPQVDGVIETLRRMGKSCGALLRNRFELFTVEWQEEKFRLLNLLVWLGLALAFVFAGVFIAVATLAFWLWNTAGYLGLIGLALACLIIAAGVILGLRRKILASSTPFAQTLSEFRKDGECWHKNN